MSCLARARRRFALSPGVKLVGWLPVLGSVLGVTLLLALNGTVWRGRDDALLPTARAVETVVPLAVGLQAAFLLSPEDEPPLELLLTSPRPLWRVLAERALAMAALQGSVALIGSLVALALGVNESLVLVTARWAAPSVFVGGAALAVSVWTHRGNLSALVTLLLWSGMLVGGSAAVERIFFLRPVHVFMQPMGASLAAYARNRVSLTLLGLALVELAAYATCDEERMLGVRQPPRSGWSHWLKLSLVGLAGGLVMFYAGYAALWVDAQTRPARNAVCCITPADLGFNYRDVTFTSNDGVILSGWYIPSQNRAAVILLHGYGANRLGMMDQAGMLARHGYGVLLYDMRAHGESGGNVRAFGWPDVRDVASALTFLQSRKDVDPERIGILGFSIGAQVALRSAADLRGIEAVVADGPSLANDEDIPFLASPLDRVRSLETRLGFRFTEWHTGLSAPLAVVQVIGHIAPRPVLLIATGPDGDVERAITRHYYEHVGEPRALWEIPDTGHGGGPSARPQEYEEKIVAFFDAALLGDEGSR